MGSTPHGIYSASGISAILGLNQYKSPVHAWQEIMEQLQPGFNEEKGYLQPEKPDSAAIRWGNAFESAIIKLAEDKFNDKIIDREKLYKRQFEDIELSCHVDGIFQKTDDGLILHEGKTTNTRAFYSIKEDKKRWGEDGTDEVPMEYQIQSAVQRICTGADLVRLSVLVFPRSAEEWEEMGWEIIKSERHDGEYRINNAKEPVEVDAPICWAEVFQKIGNFKTYNLPSNPKLENLIIEKIKKFDADYVKTKIPPKCTEYKDVQRLLTNPMGTIIATPELKAMAAEYSEIVRQTGSSGPLAKRKEKLKTEIMDKMMTMKKNDWSDPPDKMVLLDPDGGEVLVNFGKSFRARRAR